jgi:hypothetical protein
MRRTLQSDLGKTVPNWPDHVTDDEMVTAMDRVGVDGAIFISARRLEAWRLWAF